MRTSGLLRVPERIGGRLAPALSAMARLLARLLRNYREDRALRAQPKLFGGRKAS